MQQHDLRPPKGATHKRKRVGRGNASGHGTYSTRGMKGQKARSGGGVGPHFEGGQLPFVRRMAYKRGFRNPFRVDYEEVNVGDLERFGAGAEVTPDGLRVARLVRRGKPIKILGEGEITIAVTVEADSFSQSAKSKIEAAGGTVRWIGGEPQPEEPELAAPKPRARKKAAADEGADAAPKVRVKKSEVTDDAPATDAEGEESDGAGS